MFACVAATSVAACRPGDRRPDAVARVTTASAPIETSQTPILTPSAARDAPTRRDLEDDEALGGHTLARHVGRTDGQLRERLRREPNISSASTYSDRATAEQVVAAALEESKSKVDRWLSRSGGRPNLVIDRAEAAPVGRSLRRGDRAPLPCNHVVLVLRWDARRERLYVLTSYPECGR